MFPLERVVHGDRAPNAAATSAVIRWPEMLSSFSRGSRVRLLIPALVRPAHLSKVTLSSVAMADSNSGVRSVILV